MNIDVHIITKEKEPWINDCLNSLDGEPKECGDVMKKEFRTGLGGLAIKSEGAPTHPDWFGIGAGSDCSSLSDEQYLNALQRYADHYGIDHAKEVACTRPELLEKLK